MNMESMPEIKSSAHLLAHVHAMKCESEDRLQDLSDCLTQHNNLQAAEIFDQTIRLIQQGLLKIEQYAAGMELPNIPPWQYQWHCQDQPDCLCIDQAHYMMTPLQALDLAVFNEQRLQMFCKQQMDNGIADNIKQLAAALYQLELQHIDKMSSWREQLNLLENELLEDFDPPNMPE